MNPVNVRSAWAAAPRGVSGSGVRWLQLAVIGVALLAAGMALGKDAAPLGLAPPMETNGKGGGDWDKPATWSEDGSPDDLKRRRRRKIPGAGASIIVKVGDVLRVTGKVRCAGILIHEGARLTFDPKGATLISRGNVTINGAVEMGPGSSLLIDCPTNMQYGITLKRHAGALSARGSHAFKRDCVIGAYRRDGRHNTFITSMKPRVLSFYACDIYGLGGPNKLTRDRGIYLIYGSPVLQDCRIHDCKGILFHASNATVRSNEFVKAGELYAGESKNSQIVGNYFERNGAALTIFCARWHAGFRVTDNLFVKNGVGVSIRGTLGKSAFSNNTYLHNKTGIDLRSASAPIAGETIAGNTTGVALASGLTSARMTACTFGAFQGKPLCNTRADVLIRVPGPANLVLDTCTLPPRPLILFDKDKSEKPLARWVKSTEPGRKTQAWRAPMPTGQGGK